MSFVRAANKKKYFNSEYVQNESNWIIPTSDTRTIPNISEVVRSLQALPQSCARLSFSGEIGAENRKRPNMETKIAETNA